MIHIGDSAKVLQTFDAESVDLTVTSPPYDNLRTYNGFTFDFETIARELYRVTKPGGVVVWNVADATVSGSETGTSFRQALFFKDVCGFNLHDTMIYLKASGGLPHKGRYTGAFEYMFVFSKGKPKTFNPIRDRPNKSKGRSTGVKTVREANGELTKRNSITIADVGFRFNVWEYFNGNGVGQTDKLAYQHPATFPEALPRDHILSWSNPGDLVLDPFTGSGTTGKMAKILGRRFVGVEMSPEYAALAERRIAAATPHNVLFAADRFHQARLAAVAELQARINSRLSRAA